MDKDVVIELKDVSKIYRLYDRPIDRLKESLLPFKKRYSRDFYALRDVSMTVKRGETIGFIGRNGAGKSTMLKLITGVLTPTFGTINVQGRIASLLELGAGFNPEMSGVENIYMNGAILGLSREEMEARLDDIVAFADIGDFINQPVKMYSSGMFARVAFALNAFVEPDILIVDEALSVGDAFFQAKCIHKMKKLLDGGVTVLFVSHDWGAVKNLCKRGILMDRGEIKLDSTADEAVEAYRSLQLAAREAEFTGEITAAAVESANAADGLTETVSLQSLPREKLFADNAAFLKVAAYQRYQNGKVSFANILLLDSGGKSAKNFRYGDEVILRMAIEVSAAVPSFGTGYHIRNADGMDIVYSDSNIENGDGVAENGRPGDRYVVDWKFRLWLREGNYNIAVVMSIPIDMEARELECCDFIPCAVQFTVDRNERQMGGYVHWPSQVSIRSVG